MSPLDYEEWGVPRRLHSMSKLQLEELTETDNGNESVYKSCTPHLQKREYRKNDDNSLAIMSYW